MTNIKCVGEISIFFVFFSLVSLYLALISYNEYILSSYKTFPGRPSSKIFGFVSLDLYFLKKLIEHLEFVCILHIMSMKFCFVLRCTSIFIAMNAVIELEVCFYCFERRICIRSVCFAVIHVLNTLYVYIKHPNVYA